LLSCSNAKKEIPSYKKAMGYLKNAEYASAADEFEKIEDEKPFTKEANDGLVMSAYSYYKSKDFDESLRVIEYFLRSNPINENVPYMLYLRGLNYQARITSASRDRNLMELAYQSFGDFMLRYPDTIYTKDSIKRIKEIKNMLAGNDLIVGKYYLDTKNYIGALNHFKRIVNTYNDTKYEPEALYRLIEIHDIFNLKLDASRYYSILNKKYKNSSWLSNASKIIGKYEKI
jgi:outer membrane protein assembly factor BamD